MMKSKKASQFTFIFAVVLAVVILIIMILLFSKIRKGMEESAHDMRCKSSIAAYAKLNNIPKIPGSSGNVDESDIDCPTKFVTIEKGSPLKTKREIANLMFECWNNYGEGKLLLFKPESMKFCAICSVFQFEDKSVKVDKFLSFLVTERAPIKNKDGFSPTYYDYISGSSGSDIMLSGQLSGYDQNYLSGNKRYAVVFAIQKDLFWNKFWNGAKGFAVAASIMVVLATATVVTAGVGGPLAIVALSALAGSAGAYVGADTTVSGDWKANLMTVEYSPDSLAKLDCDSIPVSMLDKKFR